MRLRRSAAALFACMALGAFSANAAQAVEGWTIGTTENQTTPGTLVPNGTHERVGCARHGTSSLAFSTTLLGIGVEWTATGIDCLEKAGSTNKATIDNTTSAGHSEGVLTFTGVKVTKPAGCKWPGEEITTEKITDHVVMDPTVGSNVAFDRFFPEVVGGSFFTIKFEGAECALAGTEASLKGSFCGELVHTNGVGGYEPNGTMTLTKAQTVLFGEAQQKTANTEKEPCAMTFGTKSLQITGAVNFELESGKPFGLAGESVATPAHGWTIGSTENQVSAGIRLGPKVSGETVKCTKHEGSSLTLAASLLGSPIELTATGVDCVEAEIDNAQAEGHSEGKFTFTGVKVAKPAGCKVPGEELTTEKLTGHINMDATAESTVVFDKYSPGANLTFVSVIFEGTECPLDGITAAVKGPLCGESVSNNLATTDKTGTLTKVQTLAFGEAQQKTGGCELKLANNPFQLTGAVDNELSGIIAGQPFGAD